MPLNEVTYTLAELADRFGLQVRGASATSIAGVASLIDAGEGQLAFLADPRYKAQLAHTHAAAVVMRREHAETFSGNALIADDPYVSFAHVAGLYEHRPAARPGVHCSAVVDPSAHISDTACIGPLSVIEAHAVVDDGAVIGPHCVVGEGCHVGAQSCLVARVTLVGKVTLGKRVRVHPGAVIGADGFGLALERDHWLKVPQLGGVRIGDDCEIGANTTIDRGALSDTVLEEDVRLDNQIQIAHNVHIGAHTAMAGCAAVAGSARIGRWCMVGGNAGILGHLEVADRVTITSKSLVTHSIRESGEYSSGVPLQENRQWRRNAARFKHLDEYARRLKALERKKHD